MIQVYEILFTRQSDIQVQTYIFAYKLVVCV